MRLLAALDQMEATLAAVEAPKRQLDGVRGWSADVAMAVRLAAQFQSPAGRAIAGAAFVHGRDDHKAWTVMCRAIIGALRRQYDYATALYVHHTAKAEVACRNRLTAETHQDWVYWQKAWAAHMAWADAAAAWGEAAAVAARAGEALVLREDKINRPVGDAIAAAGGIHQVARWKHYHQAGAV